MIENDGPGMKNAPGAIENEAQTMENYDNDGKPLKRIGGKAPGRGRPGGARSPWRASNRCSTARACCRGILRTGRRECKF